MIGKEVGRASEIETTRKRASASRDGANKVRLVPPTTGTGSLRRTGSHLLLLHLEYGRETRRRRASCVQVRGRAAILALRLCSS